MFEKIKSFIPVLIFLVSFSIASIGQNAEDFTVTDYNGVTHRLYVDYLNQGKTVVIKIFFVNCPPCVAISPAFQNLYEEWGEGDNDVEFIELSNKTFDSNADVKSYSQGLGLTFPGVGQDGGALAALNPYLTGQYGSFFGTPTFIVIAPDGSVNYDVRGSAGTTTIDALDAAIADTGAQKPGNNVLPSSYNVTFEDAFGQVVTGVDLFLGSENSSVEYPLNLSSSIFQINDIAAEYPGLTNPVLRARKEVPVLEKNSAPDILVIVRHILQLVLITDPNLQIAADTNGDGTISAIDLITLQKIILRIDDNFPNSDPYRIFPEEIPITTSPGQVQNIEFTVIKTGDLNGF